MQFYSTNRKTSPVSLREAVVRGLAADRGLFMPEVIRRFPPAFYQNMKEMTLREISFVVAEAFFGEDVEAGKLKEIVDETLNFDIPLVKVADNRYSLELFHGRIWRWKWLYSRILLSCQKYEISCQCTANRENHIIQLCSYVFHSIYFCNLWCLWSCAQN